MPYWIVHGLFHASLTKSTSYITGTCWFILVPGISPIPCQILVSLPLVKTPLGCCRDTSGPAWNSLSEEASWKSAWCQNASKFNPTIPVGKKEGKNRGKILLKMGCSTVEKEKQLSAVVSKCGPRNPEKKSTTGSACNTKKLPIHIIHQDIHLQHLDFHGEILHTSLSDSGVLSSCQGRRWTTPSPNHQLFRVCTSSSLNSFLGCNKPMEKTSFLVTCRREWCKYI